MAGEAKRLLDTIIQQRSRGNATVVLTTQTKLIIKGINPDLYTESTEDDPAIIEKIRRIGRDMGVAL